MLHKLLKKNLKKKCYIENKSRLKLQYNVYIYCLKLARLTELFQCIFMHNWTFTHLSYELILRFLQHISSFSAYLNFFFFIDIFIFTWYCNTKGKSVDEKFKKVLSKNKGYDTLTKMLDIFNGERKLNQTYTYLLPNYIFFNTHLLLL